MGHGTNFADNDDEGVEEFAAIVEKEEEDEVSVPLAVDNRPPPLDDAPVAWEKASSRVVFATLSVALLVRDPWGEEAARFDELAEDEEKDEADLEPTPFFLPPDRDDEEDEEE